MRVRRHRAFQAAFARRRVSFLQLFAVLGLAAACWYVWSRNRVEQAAIPRPAASQPVAAPPRMLPLPNLAESETSESDAPVATVTNTPPAWAPTNRVESVAGLVDTNLLPIANQSTNVGLPDWITVPEPSLPYPSHPARDVLEAQLGMANRGISPGSIDGMMGGQTREAVRAFQQQLGIPSTGELDAYTRRALTVREEPLAVYVVTTNDLMSLTPIPDTWLGKSEADRLGYQSILELVAEKGWAYPSFVRRINPDVDWENVLPNTRVKIPNVRFPKFNSRAASARIFLSQRMLQAYDASGRIMIHFPCSIASEVAKRPLGDLHVKVVAFDPNYTFDPEIFTESEEGRRLGRKLVIPPGPNNPVGIAWVGLDRPGYGIHGTPEPELVGRTESHGCFRLANWNARIFASISWVGMPVQVEP